jgi:diguanylate cyclase (GGDEF)-like protein
VVPIVRHHHENWDGTGYPDGLKGVDIPVGARIMSVVDCYDALTSDRPYRPALSSDEAFGILTERKGTMYDPRVVDAFTKVYNEINLGESQSNDRQRSLLHLIKTPLPPSDEEKAEGPAAGSSNAADEILLLSELAGGLAGHVPLDDVAEIISRHLKRVLPAPLVVLYLQEEASGDLVAAHGSGFGENLLAGLRIPLGHGLSGWVAANRTTIVNARPSLDLGDRLRALSPPLESALSTPLVTDGGLVGVLTLYAATDHAFSDDHRQVVELVARQIAASVLRARSFEHDRALMLRDELTGLPNGRLLVQLLASQGLAESNLLLSCGVLCFAVEPGLTAVGSEDGNELLVRVAAAIRKALRSSDFVFRYSARELVMLMPDSSPPVTRRIARRIFASVLADAPKSYDGAIQVGLAFAPIDGSSVEELLQAARRRMGTHGDLAEVEVDGTLARVGSGVARS